MAAPAVEWMVDRGWSEREGHYSLLVKACVLVCGVSAYMDNAYFANDRDRIDGEAKGELSRFHQVVHKHDTDVWRCITIDRKLDVYIFTDTYRGVQ